MTNKNLVLRKKIGSPIKRNIIANLFGIGVTLFTQIVLVPFYIYYWGNNLYSDWIVLTALTAFFSMSDIGLNTVTQNRFSILLAQNKKNECDSLLANNILIVSIIFIVVLAVSLSYVSVFDLTKQMNIHTLNRTETNIVFLLLMCRVFIGMYSTIEDAIFRATHNASKATYFNQYANLAVAVITLMMLILNNSMVFICAAICLPHLVLIIFKHWYSQRLYRYTFSFKDIDFKLLRNIATPSLSFLSFPLGNAIILQGYSLVINNFFGADSVVVYNTTRTMCNFIKTLLASVQSSVWPEYSISYGKLDYPRMRYLHRKTIKVAVLLSVVISVFLMIAGPVIYDIWTHSQIPFDRKLMSAFLVVLFIENLWSSSSVALLATNNHSHLGLFYVVTSVISLTCAGFIGNKSSMPVIVLTTLFMQMPLCFYTLRAGFRLTKDRFRISFRR